MMISPPLLMDWKILDHLGGDDKIANLLLLLFSHEINEINDKVGVIILHFTPDFDC